MCKLTSYCVDELSMYFRQNETDSNLGVFYFLKYENRVKVYKMESNKSNNYNEYT